MTRNRPNASPELAAALDTLHQLVADQYRPGPASATRRRPSSALILIRCTAGSNPSTPLAEITVKSITSGRTSSGSFRR